MGPNPIKTGVLRRGDQNTHTRSKDLVMTQGENSHLQTKERGTRGNQLNTLISDFHLPEM